MDFLFEVDMYYSADGLIVPAPGIVKLWKFSATEYLFTGISVSMLSCWTVLSLDYYYSRLMTNIEDPATN